MQTGRSQLVSRLLLLVDLVFLPGKKLVLPAKKKKQTEDFLINLSFVKPTFDLFLFPSKTSLHPIHVESYDNCGQSVFCTLILFFNFQKEAKNLSV